MEERLSDALREAARGVGTPCYVYFPHLIDERVAQLREAFEGRFAISYAMKANPHTELVTHMTGRADYLDVSSGGEITKAIDAGWAAQRLSFTGPGKRDWELALAVESGVGEIVLESVDEATSLNRLADGFGRRIEVLVRLAPNRVPSGFGVKMAGKPSQFGIEEDEISSAIPAIQRLPGLSIVGFHSFSGTQCLDSNALAENYSIYLNLFSRVAREHSVTLRKCVLGSGMGIPYHGEVPLNVEELARLTNGIMEHAADTDVFLRTEFVLEIGRFLVGEAGFFLTSVVRAKQSHGVNIAICDGGMNNNLGACGLLGTVIRRNYPMELISEGASDRPVETQQLVGPLCTSIDLLGHNVDLPRLLPGDLVCVRCSGAYGLSASPVHFISHPVPREVVLTMGTAGSLRSQDTRFTGVGAGPHHDRA